MRILKALLLPFLLILTLIGVDKFHGARPVLVGPAPQALLPRE
ncbi:MULTISPECIES: hypothetical protein [Pseudomonas]|nr:MULTISPECIES: hypothetical protein [Pseudomonas]